MRVAHVVAPARYGGLEEVVHRLCEGQSRQGHEVCVCAVVDPGPSPHSFVQELRSAGIAVRELRVGPRAYLREWRMVREAYRDFGATVAHTHGYRADVVDGWSFSRRDLPVVSTVHGYTGGDWKNRVYEWIQRRVLRDFDAVVAVSEPLTRALAEHGVPAERIWTIPNAWTARTDLLPREAARMMLGIGEGVFSAGWVGRLSPEKGPDVAIEALARVADPDVTLCMVGGGPMEGQLRRMAERLGVGERVRWVGELGDAARVFRGFDVFLLSSRTEGTPMVLFEATEAGVPVVASRVGGVPNVLSSAEALLVPAEDPTAIAEGVARVRREPARAAERVEAARHRVRRDFGLDEWVRRYDEVYRAVGTSAG